MLKPDLRIIKIIYLCTPQEWRGVRVVEGATLER